MLTVLLVDDEIDHLAILEMLLRIEGYRVICATSGAEALQLAAQERADLIITDFMMPGMNGLELVERLRADPRTRDVPIILTSAAPEPRVDAPPYDRFVQKPAEFDELLRIVRELTRST